MKFLRIFCVVALVCAGTAWAQTDAENVAISEKPDNASQADATPNVEPAQPADSSAPASEANDLCQKNNTLLTSWQGTQEIEALTITPVPTYCDDCKPCQAQWECGRDPSTGTWLGVCSPPGSSYCGHQSYSTCTCY